MSTNQLLITLLFLSVSPNLSRAQPDWQINRNGRSFRFEAFGPDDGLPHETVNALLQDSSGFIWMGTPAGLVRYDGYQFRTFPYQAVDSLTGDRQPVAISVNCIAEAPGGDLWVGCIYERVNKPVLLRLDRETEQLEPYFFAAGRSLLEQTIYEILIDDDHIWANTQEQLIRIPLEVNDLLPSKRSELNPEVITSGKRGLNHSYYRDLHLDVKGRLWLATDQGIYEWLPAVDSFSYHSLPIPPTVDAPADYWLKKLLDIEDGQLLAFPRQRGFTIRIDPDQGTHEVVMGLTRGSIFEAVRTLGGQIWAGVRWGTGGLQVLDPVIGHWEWVNIKIDDIDFLPAAQVKSMLVDRSGSIWIGTDLGPLIKYEPHRNEFHWLRHDPGDENSLSHDWVTGISQDQNGHYWLPTYGGGLNRWDREGNRFLHIRARAGQPDDKGPLADLLIGVEVARDGKIWFGEGFSAGAYDPSSGSFDHYRESGVVFSTFQDVQGRIWLAKFGGGLRMYERESDDFRAIGIPHPTRPGEVIHPALSGIFQDSRGDLWLGSHSQEIGGFFRFDPEAETFTPFELPEAHSFTEDRQGRIWIASKDGLYRFDPAREQFKRYGTADGLPYDDIKSVLMDDHGRLWLAAGNSLSCFDLAQDTMQHYSVSDGIPAGTFNNTNYKNASGELFFAGTFGLLYFHPDSLRRSVIPPELTFTGIDLFGAPLTVEQDGPLAQSIVDAPELNLAHWQNDLTIRYAALHFKNPEKNRYRVKLSPYDADWREVGYQSFAGYTNLDPGHYTFRVKAANSDGVWNEEGIALGIVIQPPWFWNFWSKALYLFLILGGITALYRFQLNRRLAMAEAGRLRELDEVKTRLYTNITHEFRTPITVIQGTVEQIKDYETEKVIIQRNSQNLLDLINRMLDLSKLEAGKLQLQMVQGNILPYLSYITESFHSLALNQRINLNFYSDEEELIMDYDPEKILQILSNLISNAIKFTQEYGKVTIVARNRMTEMGETLVLRVKDTGIGIKQEDLAFVFDRFHQADSGSTRRAEGTGIGLALTKELVELMTGTIRVESEEGAGSVFTITLPVTNNAVFESSPRKISSFPMNGSGDIGYPEKINGSAAGQKDSSQGDGYPRLLIVEDNLDVMQFIASCLSSDYELIFARNGGEGIEQALEHIPDIIISDVMMPKVDGFELCSILKQEERTSHIPIILLTAKADMDSKLEGLEHGADAYLVKPFHRAELEVRLRKLLDLRQKLQKRYNQPEFEPEPATEKEDAFVLKVRQLILDHLDDDAFGPEQLSEAIFLHRSHLHRKLKALTGKSTSIFIREIRLQRADQLLRENDLSVKEVAYEVGFSDPGYFSKLFTEKYGRPPSEV